MKSLEELIARKLFQIYGSKRTNDLYLDIDINENFFPVAKEILSLVSANPELLDIEGYKVVKTEDILQATISLNLSYDAMNRADYADAFECIIQAKRALIKQPDNTGEE